MPILIRMNLVAAVLSLVLSACSSAQSATVIAATAPPPTHSLPTPLPTDEPLGVAVPAVQFVNGQNQLVMASAMTGKVLEAFTPIPLGAYYSYAYAPGGHALAVVSSTRLFQVELPSLEVLAADVDLQGWMSGVGYSPDGTQLAIASGEPDASLRIVNTKNGGITARAQAGISVRAIKFTDDGKALMVYGAPVATIGPYAGAGVSIGAPKAELLSAADLRVVWSTDLPGIRDGTFPKQPNTPDIYQPGAAWHYSPATAFAPNGDVLYAVHGDEEKLTTVDFAKRKVSTVRIQSSMSWLNRLLALTAGVAHAKGMDGTNKQGVISPDGKYFFVVGSTETVTKQARGSNFDITVAPIGLEMVAVRDGTLQQKIASEAYNAQFSSDGRHLFLTGWNENSSRPWTDIYDMASASITKHLVGVQLVPARRLDGTPIVQSGVMISDNVCDMASVNPDTWTLVSSWRAPVCDEWLAAP